MHERTTLEQLKDEFALWLLLYKLEEAGFKTQRLKLQKLMYLIDIFGSILNEKPTNYTFLVYKHGPYTKEIQSDVEHLAAKGLVNVKELARWSPCQERSFEYKIVKTNIGKAREVFEILDFTNVERTIDFVTQAAGFLTSKNIQSLVYAEPNFLSAKKLVSEGRKQFATEIDSTYNFLAEFRQISDELYLTQYGTLPTPETVIWLYFNFIKSIESKGNRFHESVDE